MNTLVDQMVVEHGERHRALIVGALAHLDRFPNLAKIDRWEYVAALVHRSRQDAKFIAMHMKPVSNKP